MILLTKISDSFKAFVFLLLQFFILIFPLLSNNDLSAAQLQKTTAGKLVLTFYYPWYGTIGGKGGSGRVIHWGKIDSVNKDISDSTDYPLIGAYDSYEQKVLEQHCEWAKKAGIDCFIVSWWGHNSYEDKAMPLILQACEKSGLQACIYYESAPKTSQQTADDIVRALEKYGSHPAYLKVNSKPVVFIYGRAIGQLGLFNWYQTLSDIRSKFKPDIIAIGDQLSSQSAIIFDGIHTYNTAGQLANKTIAQADAWSNQDCPQWVKIARQADKISTITVIPGYDDTKIRKPGLKVERFESKLYQVQWENAIISNPDWVLITSFNEWHEGSEIEPSLQYGQKYIELTAKFAKQFKSTKTSTQSTQPTFTELEKQLLKDKLKNIKIAVAPNPDSYAFWFLTEFTDKFDILSWPQIADGKLAAEKYGLLLYCLGENYVTSVKSEGDVDKAILDYLSKGGLLAALPSGPLPFYYNEKGRAVNNARKFGLTFQIGWEKPPDNLSLKFVQPDRSLKHLPQSLPFPQSGDLRWRPIYRESIYTSYRPLLQLTDDKSNFYGDAIAVAQLKSGGKIAYCWFGLQNTGYSDGLLYDLFVALVDGSKTSQD